VASISNLAPARRSPATIGRRAQIAAAKTTNAAAHPQRSADAVATLGASAVSTQ